MAYLLRDRLRNFRWDEAAFTHLCVRDQRGNSRGKPSSVHLRMRSEAWTEFCASRERPSTYRLIRNLLSHRDWRV